MLLTLYTHPSRAASLREADQVHVEPDVPVEEFTDPFGNRCARIVAPPGKLRLWNKTLIEDSGEPDEVRRFRPAAACREFTAGGIAVPTWQPVL